MNRRSFFNRIARAAAIVALAPQIAFRAPKLNWEDEAWLTHEIEMKAFGVSRYSLYDFIMDRARKEGLSVSTS